MWQAWSEPARFAQWGDPKSCTLKLQTMQFEAGGTLHYAMQWAGMPDMWGKFVFTDITPPQSPAYVSSFANAAGDITRAPCPGMDTWPLAVANTVSFTEDNGRTTLTLRGTPLRANEGERTMFAGFFGSMTQGFSGTLDQREVSLAAAICPANKRLNLRYILILEHFWSPNACQQQKLRQLNRHRPYLTLKSPEIPLIYCRNSS